MKSPEPLPKPTLHRGRSSASSYNIQSPPFFLRSSSSCIRLISRLPITLILPYIFFFFSITCFRRQFLRKMWPIQLTFLLFMYVGCSCPHWLYVLFFRPSQLILSVIPQHHLDINKNIEKWVEKFGLDTSVLGWGSVAGCCENCNELLLLYNTENFLSSRENISFWRRIVLH